MTSRVDVPSSIDPLDLVEPGRFASNGYPHALWATLRAEAPVVYLEPEGYVSFWAVTKHADITDVASRPERFSSAHGLILGHPGAPAPPSEMVVMLDPPRHGPLRRAAMPRFTPRAIRSRHEEIDRIAVQVLDDLADSDGEEFDFVERVAAPLPIGVISWILGVPGDDWKLLFQWTNQIIGKDDPEFRRPGETAGQTIRRARGELHAYLEGLIAARRIEPGDDIVSQLIAAEVDGRPLTPEQLLDYAELMVEAGNETTRNAISGGLLAFSEHPDQWERLKREPGLLPTAVEEILRWVSPIIHFVRTATEDCEFRGERIAAGDKMALFYASANRDEDVFDEPFAFRVDRQPNHHLAFGSGPHFCMGANLARVELETLFRHLLARLEWFELTAPAERLNSAVNGGIKHLNLRCRLT
ncbi:MAG: cytochrome P450 [Acidimicrobiales bacterium]|jgi:cholest-4-en-3-one 26-monooxygenase